MTPDLTSIDPAWAWAPFNPSPDQPFDRRAAAHLYRRAGFAANSSELDQAVNDGLPKTVTKLLHPDQPSPDQRSDLGTFQSQITQLGQTIMAAGNPKDLAPWWLYRMIHTPDQNLEKLTLFWHGHFATSAAKVEDAALMKAHDSLLRSHARGNFARLTQAIARDPAMLLWLDSTANRKARPNENFARELLELFCLGLGNYSEDNIREIARTFTGWEVRRDRFQFNPHQHDPGSKSFFNQSGPFQGDDAIRIVLQQPAAPRLIARKLARFFLCDEPDFPDHLIEPLASLLRQNNFEISPALEQILTCNLFFSPHAVGQKVRSPVELGVGLLRALQATTNQYQLNDALGQLGQALYYPPNVKGWDGGRSWINSSTLLGRANLVRHLLTDKHTQFTDGSLSALTQKHSLTEPDQTVDWFLELLVPMPIPAESRNALLKIASEKPGDTDRQLADLIYALSLLPEFQLA